MRVMLTQSRHRLSMRYTHASSSLLPSVLLWPMKLVAFARVLLVQIIVTFLKEHAGYLILLVISFFISKHAFDVTRATMENPALAIGEWFVTGLFLLVVTSNAIRIVKRQQRRAVSVTYSKQEGE